MNETTNDEKGYRLPSKLSPIQLDLYRHLIAWKWRNITKEPGRSHGRDYDAILPEHFAQRGEWPHLYPGTREELRKHLAKNPFRIHQHFFHMASSQAATINLFLPLLSNPAASSILQSINPDIAELATDVLDQGYCLEYWGWNLDHDGLEAGNNGPLGDKSSMAGTDADIAIAYRNHQGELCLWLIEHKLTEKEFTACGGSKSRGRQDRHDCSKSFAELVENPIPCYYHEKCRYAYWAITKKHRDQFPQHAAFRTCPFRGGMNQLWRNQLLGLAIEDDPAQPFRRVIFSVVKHPENYALDATLDVYTKLIGGGPKFSVLNSAQLVQAAEEQGKADLNKWASWYRGLYKIKDRGRR